MIYLFIGFTGLTVIIWLWKLFHFLKLGLEVTDAEYLTLRSLPATIVVLAVILYYFWTSEINALHLLYIYPIAFYASSLFFGLVFSADIVRKDPLFRNK